MPLPLLLLQKQHPTAADYHEPMTSFRKVKASLPLYIQKFSRNRDGDLWKEPGDLLLNPAQGELPPRQCSCTYLCDPC